MQPRDAGVDTDAVKRVLLADMALQNGAAGRDLTMATKRFRQAVFKTTFKKNKHMVSSVAPSRAPLFSGPDKHADVACRLCTFPRNLVPPEVSQCCEVLCMAAGYMTAGFNASEQLTLGLVCADPAGQARQGACNPGTGGWHLTHTDKISCQTERADEAGLLPATWVLVLNELF